MRNAGAVEARLLFEELLVAEPIILLGLLQGEWERRIKAREADRRLREILQGRANAPLAAVLPSGGTGGPLR